MDFFIKNERHRKLGFLFFVLYLVLLTYFLFFAEEMGRTPGIRAGYSYNLTPLKEIRRFLTHADVLGWRAVFLNIVGNMAAFMPFGFFLPEIWSRVDRWYTTTLLGAVFSPVSYTHLYLLPGAGLRRPGRYGKCSGPNLAYFSCL